MATHSSILAWRIPWTEEPGGLYCPQGRKESDTTELLHFHFYFSTPVSDSYCMISRTVGLTEASVCSLQLEPYISHMCKKILFIIYNLQSLITTIFTNDEMLYYKKSPLVYPHFFSVISHSFFFFFKQRKNYFKYFMALVRHLFRGSLVAQQVKNLPANKRCRFNSWVRKSPWRRSWLPPPVFLPGESHGQRSLANYSP